MKPAMPPYMVTLTSQISHPCLMLKCH